jgi:hypothetical protein
MTTEGAWAQTVEAKIEAAPSLEGVSIKTSHRLPYAVSARPEAVIGGSAVSAGAV